MPDRTPTDEHLRNLAHFDSGLDARIDLDLFQSILQRQSIDDCCEHTHVIRRNAVESLRACSQSAENISAPNYDSHLHAELVDVLDFGGHAADDVGVDAES